MFARIETGFVRLNQAVVVLLMGGMALLVFTNVVTRYVFGFSLNWAEESSRYAMIWVTYLGAGLAMREGRHVAIEYVQSLLPARWVPWVRGLVALVVLAFMVVLVMVGTDIVDRAWRQRTPVLGWPMGAMYLSIPIGAGLFALHFLLVLRTWLQQPPNAIDADVSAPGTPAAVTPEARR